MRTNKEKWDFLIEELNKKSKEFIKAQEVGVNISDKFYYVDYFGDISEITILGIKYIHRNDAVIYYGNKPSHKNLDILTSYVYSNIIFDIKNILLYCYKNGDDNFNVYLSDFSDSKCYFKLLIDAENKSSEIKREKEENKDFYKINAKSANYNYDSNGYTFLGWQNTWEGEPKILQECRAKNHRYIEVKVGNKGMDNTVSCHICKIYWKYDCSD